tara:strand:+ start:374 stop:664 length:291 start_codon:yes stop_codon:yes gene_type:complete
MIKKEEKIMKNTNKLIKDLIADSKSKFAIENDMVDMYAQDAADTQKSIDLIKSNKISQAAKHISYLDTAIREGVVIALAKDLGNDWVAANLGWEVN